MVKIAIVVEDDYQVLEVWYPLLRFREEGFTVDVFGFDKEEYDSKEGYPIEANRAFKELQAKNYDCVVIPGGYAPDRLRRYKEVVSFVREMNDRGKVVAAICHGPWVLASADVLRGKKATCFFSIKDDVVNAGAKYSDEEVVVDGKLVTSRKPDDLPAFCKAVIKILKP
ncbi:type 1 glutamine amidotransferase [Candidatus Micrarchaeota archaeon]|nr:type 1 glutamine amidotransferase [Candidatus Micrarchaeota archaeon]